MESKMPQVPFAETKFETFAELEAFNSQIYLDPSNNHVANRTYRTTFYRGQADSEWSLIPSLFRDLPDLSHIPLSRVKQAFEKEYSVVSDFIAEADQMGYPIEFGPSKCLSDRRLCEETWRYWAETVDTAEREHIALAQHYGAKTRFVDFTQNFLVAVFFAAQEAFKMLLQRVEAEDVSSKYFSIWMLDTAFFAYQSYKGDRFDFEEIRTPKARNPFLRAQGGTFLTPKIHLGTKSLFSLSDFDLKEAIVRSAQSVASDADGSKVIWPILRRLDLPYLQAADCLVHLENRGVTWRSIWPSLENIIDSFSFSKSVHQWISDQESA